MATKEIDRDSIFFTHLPADFSLGDDAAQQRLFREYGAVFVARGGVTPPSKVVFSGEDEVREFQSSVGITQSKLGPFQMELQSAAMDGLLDAIDKATTNGLSITPRGSDSARRNYTHTIELWESRVEPALVHWVDLGSITAEQADHIRSLTPYEQVPEVFALEEQGIFFAKDLSKSIIYSVAPPGASQHLSMLAFDVAEFNQPEVRRILAESYWYQTVVSDLPHFTFLGVGEGELESLGLKKVTSNDRDFWVPDV